MKRSKLVIVAVIIASLGLSACESTTQADYIALQKELSEVKLELLKTQDALRVAERQLDSFKEEEEEDFLDLMGKEEIHNKEEKIEKIKESIEELGALIEASYSEEDLEKLITEYHKGQDESVQYIYFGTVDDIFSISPQIQLPENYRYSQRPSYIAAVENTLYIADIYVDAMEDRVVQTVTKALYVDDELIGVVGIDVYLD